MESTSAWLLAVGQTVALVGAILVAVAALSRLRREPQQQVTAIDLWDMHKLINRATARQAIGWGAGLILLGLLVGSAGAWMHVAAV